MNAAALKILKIILACAACIGIITAVVLAVQWLIKQVT
jgi:hypothetical protein